jgi:hypothetical protein
VDNKGKVPATPKKFFAQLHCPENNSKKCFFTYLGVLE